jgi:codanin-1
MDSIKIDSNKMPTIEANPNSITNSNQLEVIINIYAIILKSNLVPNFIEELKFICELVTKRVTKEFNHEIDPQMNLFLSSYHNCVYFSVKLLEELLLNQRLINCLNKTTLKLMIESINITKFSPLLKENLMLMLETDKPVNNNANNNLKTTLESVLFQSETDTKSNFPNDHSFHLFRKQRDEFYQIYNNYRQKDNALKGGKESNLKIINSIKHLFSLSRDSGNMSHLSRLFVSQLLQSCVNRGLCSQNTDFSEETTDDNETVRNLLPDRERLRKLQKRFNKSSTKLWDTNLFSKEEQFFRDFIFYGDSHAFNEHLKYLLSHKLLEFNSFEVLNFDNDLNEVQVLRNRFRNNLITLKIIAKFLAYVTFYPFDTTLSNNNVQEFIESQTRLRSQSKPLIDLENCLREAIEKNKLLMTVPWIVEFLCFIDPISARIVYYQNLSNFLVVIYKTYLPNIIHFCPTNGLFILFYLTKVFINKNLDLNERFYRIIFKDNYFDKPNINSSDNSLDFLSDLIDSDFFHDFCPHFNNDLTLIFKHNVVNEVRKITPLTMPLIDKDVKQLIDDKKDNNDEQLRLQIEEQFFNSHSPSLKKTVDFVSDRITSKCIKKVRTEIFMQSKQSFYNSNVKNNEEFICDKIRSQCKSFVKDYCTQQTNTIFPLLMNEDIDESVLQFSIKIAIKLAIDKCINWIDNNITQSLIENDLKTELENMTKQLNEKEESEKDQKKKEESVVVDISSTFTSIRDLMADLYEDKPINDNSIIVKLVNELSELKRSKTLPKKTLEFIDVNIVDFSIALIANQPKILSDTIIKLFIDYWVEFNITVEKYICPRNVYILSICKSPNLSWSKFESFLLNMLSKQIVSPLIIENDCLWTLKEEWDDSVLNRFASCLKSIVNFNQINGKNGDMLDTIDWLSWFCSQSD